MGSGGASTDLPPQAIPLSKKTDKWKRATMDSLESIGIKQFNENKRFADYFRMTEGKVSYTELSELVPQMRELEGLLDDFHLPSTIKHFDLLGVILNYLETVITENEDKFHVTNVDEIATNERQREQNRLMVAYFNEQFQLELDAALNEQGLDRNKQDFQSEEEQQQYQQTIEQAEAALTPQQIKGYLDKTWKTVGVEWAEHTLTADRDKLSIKEIDRTCVNNFLRTGRMFKHYYIKDDHYSTEAWSPLNTFVSQTINTKYPQNGEYAGRVHFYTPSDFVNAKGKYLSEKEKESILNNNSYYSVNNGYHERDGSFEQGLRRNFTQNTAVPFGNYHDHQFLTSLEEETGIPMAKRTIYKKDGTQEVIDDFLPRYGTQNSAISNHVHHLRTDLNLRNDMIMVTEAYFRSWKRVGYLTFLTESGLPTSEIVTEDILTDFLKENEITQLRTMSLEEVLDKKKNDPTALINTIVWDYVPEIWKGEKAKASHTNLKKDLYYNIAPLEFQIKGKSNVYDLQLPVSGYVGINPSDKIMPFQNSYNVALNAADSLAEKELGVFFLFDIRMLPSDIKDYGDTETALYNTMNMIKSTSLLGGDFSRSNVTEGSVFNQFSVQDLSLGRQIMEKHQQANTYKLLAYEQFGLSPQALYGDPVKYQTATGVEQVTKATHSQTDYLYEIFNNFKERDLEIHLAVAQYYQSTKDDIVINYNKGDMSQVFLELVDPDLPLRRFGIKATSDSKKRRNLEQMKSFMLSNPQQGTDSLEMAEILQSDSMQTLIELAQLERKRKDLQIQQQQQAQLQQIQEEARLLKEAEQATWTLAEISKQRDRENDIRVKYIDALGRAADGDADIRSLDIITNNKDIALRQEAQTAKINNDAKALELKIEETRSKLSNNSEELNLKAKELALKAKEIEANKYIARINKN